MTTPQLAPLLAQVQRRALVTVLRDHPHWTLGDLLGLAQGAGPRAHALRELRLHELLSADRALARGTHANFSGLHRERLGAARQARGPLFDEFVCEVLEEAAQAAHAERRAAWVTAGYLRARVGGPRWKLQASLVRVIEAGLVERRGRTSSSRYRRAPQRAVESEVFH